MYSFTYENQGTNTYLVYLVKGNEDIDTLSLGMITNNSISGLAQTTCLQMDENKYIKYNITAKISVKQFFEGSVNKRRLLSVFKGIVNAMLSAEDYMIDPNMILLDTNYIFADVTTCETDLVCLPIIKEAGQQEDICLFFKNIMFSAQFDQGENCDYIAKIMNSLNVPVFSLVDFKNVLDSIETKKSNLFNQNTVVKNSTANSINTVSENVNKCIDIRGTQPSVDSENTVVQSAQKIIKQEKIVEPKQTVEVDQQSINVSANNASESQNEKPMSKLYLLQHYTKENKAIYEAQRMAKKSKDKKKSANKKENKKESKNPGVNTSFAVPGTVEQNTPLSNVQRKTDTASSLSIKSMKMEPQKSINSVPQSRETVSQPIIQQPAMQQKAEGKKCDTEPTKASTAFGGFGETVVLNAGMTGDTTVLNTNMLNHVPDTPYLTRIKTNEKVHINKPSFRIGKEKSFVDYFIGDNTAISRSHANIHERDGEYYIIDTNSTNHTYVDNQMVPSNQEYPIKSGAKIRLANEDFIFTIE